MNKALTYLDAHWQAVFGKNYPDLFHKLVMHYQQSHRHYHNLTHLYECFLWFDTIKNQLCYPDLVAIALFYHDIIYNPKSNTNEQDSSDTMQLDLKGILSDQKLSIIDVFILATKHHINPLSDEYKSDLDYLLDIDLAILGSHSDRFDEYNHQIRQEYAWVNGLIYHFKRKSVLRAFYQRDRIYLTEYFYNTLETKAKENLKRQL